MGQPYGITTHRTAILLTEVPNFRLAIHLFKVEVTHTHTHTHTHVWSNAPHLRSYNHFVGQ